MRQPPGLSDRCLTQLPPWAHTTRVSTDDRLSLNVTDNPARLDVGYQRFWTQWRTDLGM
jgi:hypothetical protein